MAIEDLLKLIPPPASQLKTVDKHRWKKNEKALGIHLPTDYFDYVRFYGSGCFDDHGRLLIFVWNPCARFYLKDLRRICEDLCWSRELDPRSTNCPYGVFPSRPGWLPWGSDMDGNLMCWLTEGEPDQWPLILLTSDHTGFQQLDMPMTTFLARAFTRKIQSILWANPIFFSGPEPIRFLPGE